MIARAFTASPVIAAAVLGLSLAACTHAPPAGPPIPVAQILREPCPRPPRPATPTIGELAGFSVRQEAAITVCEERKTAAVAIIDAVNALTHPRPWWKLW